MKNRNTMWIIILILVVFFLFLAALNAWRSGNDVDISSQNNNDSSSVASELPTNSLIDLDANSQNFIMIQINKINSNDDVNESMENVNTASSIYFNYHDVDATDLINFIHSLSFSVGTAVPTRWGLYTSYGLPLSYIMVSSKILSKNSYQIKAVIQIKLDQSSLNIAKKLLQNPDLIKKYNPIFSFDFATIGNTNFVLDDSILTNQKSLVLNVTLISSNGNSDWDSYSILVSPSNNLKPYNDDSNNSNTLSSDDS